MTRLGVYLTTGKIIYVDVIFHHSKKEKEFIIVPKVDRKNLRWSTIQYIFTVSD